MKATRADPEIVTRNGKLVSVILPIKDHEQPLKRARKKPLHYCPLEDYLAGRERK